MNRKTVYIYVFAVITAMFLSSCSLPSNKNVESGSSNILLKEKAAEYIAKYENVGNKDIEILSVGGTVNKASVSYREKKNNQWEPDGEGWFMAQLTKDKNETYEVTMTLPRKSGHRESLSDTD
ncbi:hypothetical protein KZ483_20920 [Paenibacillus sp. sptzw28]|uniref:hypothetical protein n=1 Tax=Paenibacillus sp. sptzw28 TaxID=715179 RepID=UPI001C6EE71E|nr:hypothetical protein [Paenibacillus sp. sptzw28]QYR20270.1 hypothetical protein KZ483_20920 [Paenibacillus sp. sptzw28]